METNPRVLNWIAILAVVGLILLPQFADRYVIQLFTKIMIMAIFAMSLGLLVSGAGLISLGHAAYFGLGAYLLVLLSPDGAGASLWQTLPLAVGGAALVALVLGALAVRTSGIYFIMLTLAFGQMLFYLFHDGEFAGGSDGRFMDSRPVVEVFGHEIMSLTDRPTLFYTVLVAMGVVYGAIGMVMRAPFGQVLLGIRVNEARMRSLGFNTYLYKLAAFVLAGAIAGFAGYLYAAQYRVVNPALFSWRESGIVLMMVILGGLRYRLGPLIGAFALVLLEEALQSVTEYWLLGVGIFVILVVLVLPDGLTGLLARRKQPAGDPDAEPTASPARSDAPRDG
jgi:branched-chain amino acid transport system permease protein